LFYLYDRDSEKKLALNARQVAAWLGVALSVRDIGPEMERRGIYTPLSMRLLRLSGLANRLVIAVYRMAFGESPFVTYLRAGAGDSGVRSMRRKAFGPLSRFAQLGFNARHVYRRELLEEQAEATGWLTIGAANRSEWKVGWFVKDGIDDMPYQPLIGLYKTQVRQMARFLGLPNGVLTHPPSPDMMKGITDEFALGLNFAKIDPALDHLEGGISTMDLEDTGVTAKDLRYVRELMRLSEWKRRPLSLPLAADGGLQGGLRT
jgi:NAD+ synthase